MIVIIDEETGYKIVSIEGLGWLFYDPRTKQPKNDIFIHYDDLMKQYVRDWALSTGKVLTNEETVKETFFSYEFGKYLLQRFVKTLSLREKPLLSNGLVYYSLQSRFVSPLQLLELAK